MPGLGEILVRVRAVGLNPPDWYLREGYEMLPPEWRPDVAFPVIPGTDISGVVESVAEDVEGFAAGDAVYAMVRFPSGLAGQSRAYAEYVTVPASEVALKPFGIDHERAAGAPMSLLTAWQFLVDPGHDEPNPLQPRPHEPRALDGRTVLVNGAAGGVGHFAVQIAKLKGAHVIAVASGRNETLLRSLGADEFIDYARVAPEDTVRGIDLVIDAVGGPGTGRFLRTLKRGGALFPDDWVSRCRRPRCGRAARNWPNSPGSSMRGPSASSSTASTRSLTHARLMSERQKGTSRARSSSQWPGTSDDDHRVNERRLVIA